MKIFPHVQKLGFAILLTVFLPACTGMASKGQPLSADEKQKIVQRLIENKDFLGLFHEAPKIGEENLGANRFSIDDVIGKYIKICCSDRKEGLDLLLKNGFEIHYDRPYDPKHEDSWHKFDRETYDEKIMAERIAAPVKFMRWTTYRVIYYLKDKKIKAVKGMSLLEGIELP